MQPDPSWQGPIAFYEMIFGTWLSYITLVIIWEKVLRSPLREWQYVLLTCFASSFFVINHYFFFAPLYVWVINAYALVYFFVWYWLGLRQPSRPLIWKFSGLALGIVNSFLYVGFEMLARLAVNQGVHEFWVLTWAYIGFSGVILWRRTSNPENLLNLP